MTEYEKEIDEWDRASIYDWTKFEKELAEDNIEISEKQKQELLKHFNDRKRKWEAGYNTNAK